MAVRRSSPKAEDPTLRAGRLRGMSRLRPVLVILAIAAALLALMAVQIAKERAHPLGHGTLGQRQP